MAKNNVINNAPGQLLGYSIQFPRALFRILKMQIGESVGIEAIGDVASFYHGVPNSLEEDKSSVGRNPLTDTSENLWKTFYNWIEIIKKQDVSPDTVRFILYTNRVISYDSLVYQFHEVDSVNSAELAIGEARKRNKSNKGKSKRYYDYVMNDDNLPLFMVILRHFELETTRQTEDLYTQNIYNAVREKLIPEQSISWIIERLSGWLLNSIQSKISQHEPTLISFDEFSSKFESLFQQAREKTLIDFALDLVLTQDNINENIRSKPTYIRQLEIINAKDDDLIDAVSVFFRANCNRLAWIEKEIIDESTMSDFQNRLVSYYKNRHKSIEIAESSRPEEERGMLLMLDCQQRNETIANQTPPDGTIQGSYHFLADQKEVGWHPRWEQMITE